MNPMRSTARLCVFLFILTAAALASPPGHLPAAARARTAAGLRQVEQIWVAALKAGDSATVACLLDPTFIDTDWQCVLRSRAQMLAAARTPPLRSRSALCCMRLVIPATTP